MTDSDTLKSLYQFVQSGYQGTIHEEIPAKFDAVASDLESWIVFYADRIDGDPHRRTQGERARIRVTARAYGRKGGNIYTSFTEAQAVKDLLHQAVIPIRDYDESGEPQIGTLMLEEATITRMKEEDSQWQEHLVTVEGTAYPE